MAMDAQMKEDLSKTRVKPSNPDSWVEQYGDYLYRFALSRIQDPSVAEDLVQDTFLAALGAYDKFKGQSSERTWLTAILKHKLVDHLRKKSREQPVEDVETHLKAIDEFLDGKGRWKLGPSKWTFNPVKHLEQKQFWEVFTKCLSDLPTRLGHAFKLREMDGLNCDDICNVLDITPSNCWIMLYRARMHLRRCLEHNWLDAETREG